MRARWEQIHTLMLIRHGESQWNIENRFTGWVDVPLAPTGIAESHRAANEIKKEGFTPDIVYTSTLKRAIKTAWNVLEDNDIMHTPVVQDWRLNERMYGQLQGESPVSCNVLNLGATSQRALSHLNRRERVLTRAHVHASARETAQIAQGLSLSLSFSLTLAFSLSLSFYFSFSFSLTLSLSLSLSDCRP